MPANNDLRLKVARMVKASGEGHIPSSFSIIDLIDFLYGHVLKIDPKSPKDPDRDYFILSKGHGAAGFFAVLHKYGFVSDQDIADYSTSRGILGGHPDTTKVPGAEASTGSLGHGFPTAVGTALGLRIRSLPNRVFALLGDGECHEGTIWESANVGANQKLGNLCAIVDWNGSAAQLMAQDDLPAKWAAFGWEVHVIDGHDTSRFPQTFTSLSFSSVGRPKVIIARTVKGKGVSITEGHGKWHHRIPNDEEMVQITQELTA
ncbi:MAG: transketolase [Opitutaceae bacterium]|nr:transketolase [Opitutaceae bacterium]